DYERLILEESPSICKVRCGNRTDDSLRLSPGNVGISGVPDCSKLKGVNKMEPKVSLAQLEQIKRFFEDRNCGFVRNSTTDNLEKPASVHVLNPRYEKIRISMKVRFRSDISSIELHIEKLKTAVLRFLSPWAFEDSGQISFGGKVFKSVILHFVEKQSYVEYIKDFKMMHGDMHDDLSFIESKTP